MTRVGVHEAKTHFSKLLRRVMAGEEIVIERSGEPVAKLVPVKEPSAPRFFEYEGVFEVPDDFDELPEDLLDAFES